MKQQESHSSNLISALDFQGTLLATEAAHWPPVLQMRVGHQISMRDGSIMEVTEFLPSAVYGMHIAIVKLVSEE